MMTLPGQSLLIVIVLYYYGVVVLQTTASRERSVNSMSVQCCLLISKARITIRLPS